MVSLYLANTDNQWFDFLASIPHLEEVNFWQPSAKNFKAIKPGELFVFRLKAPRGFIGGFGVLSNSSILPIHLAWDAFGQANGVASKEELIRAIRKYRSDGRADERHLIGCRILVQPVFFPLDQDILAVPSSWASNIVGGKRYSTDEPDGNHLWHQLMERVDSRLSGFFHVADQPRFGKPQIISPRLGQGAFRIAVMDAYSRACALSGGRVLPALDAAHIRPYADGGEHDKPNGILLRKDIHCVFDAGYATFDENYRFVVSERVKEEFNNGNEYRRLHGKQLILPKSRSDWPATKNLQWHQENCFIG